MSPLFAFVVAASLLFASASAGWSVLAMGMREVLLTRVRSPSRRANVAWLLGVAPPLLAFLFVVGAAAPAIPSLAGLDRDYCFDHGGHGHFCPAHAPAASGPATVVAAALWVATATRGARLAAASSRARRSLAALARVGTRRGDVEVWVPGDARLCHAAGVWAPRVLVSDALVASMPPAELAAALAHEHAHVRRRDPLAVALLRVAGLFVPSPCARRAERDFRAAAEEAADAAAAYAVGDGRVVASALVRLTRISLRAPALAAADRGVERRVEALLANPAGEAGSSGVVLLAQALFVLTVAAPLAGVGETHHVVGFHAAVERVVEAVMHGFPVAEPTHRHG